MRPLRARSSITSTILDDLDASDDLDVATDVATSLVGVRDSAREAIGVLAGSPLPFAA